MSTCSVCGTVQETGSSFCGRCGNAFPRTAPPPVASAAMTETSLPAVAPAESALVEPAPPAAVPVRTPDGAAGILTFTADHVLVQGDSVMQRWSRATVRDIRHDDSSVQFVAAGQRIDLAVTAGNPGAVLGPSSGAPDMGPVPAGDGTSLPSQGVAWTVVVAIAAGTLGLLLMLADDLPFALAGGLWMVGVVTPGIAALRAVLRSAPAGDLVAFDAVGPVIEPTAQFAPAIGGFGALLLLTEDFPGAPFLVWVPMAVATGVAARLLWRFAPNRTDEGGVSR